MAHEINTPVQYVGDNLTFLREAFVDLMAGSLDDGYLLREIPQAITQSLEGIEQVGTIVRALKEFSHPGTAEKEPVDINAVIDATLTITRNEWRHVAEVVTDLDDTRPSVFGQAGPLKQVLLNLIVNAAHAIEQAGRDGGGRGTITVRSRAVGDTVRVELTDTGTGIPADIQAHIFESFFTTKGVGRGSGQGLAVARAVIVDQHHGRIGVRSEVGHGATFTLDLPAAVSPGA